MDLYERAAQDVAELLRRCFAAVLKERERQARELRALAKR